MRVTSRGAICLGLLLGCVLCVAGSVLCVCVCVCVLRVCHVAYLPPLTVRLLVPVLI